VLLHPRYDQFLLQSNSNSVVPVMTTTVLLTVTTVFYWRGIWELWDVLVFP
jgi:hypothetical protein